MGMFDSVFVACPKCHKVMEFQSKAGECDLKRYRSDSVPPEIAIDLAGEQQECECGSFVKLIPAQPIQRVRMVAVDGNEEEDEEYD